MGNCQAIDNATLVIQHPCGRVEKLYWPVKANDVMKLNPGHYVALLLTTTTTTTTTTTNNNNNSNIVRITRIKLLRPIDTLILGQAYRLITAQEVMKVVWAKKFEKMKKKESETEDNKQLERVKQKLGCEFQLPPTTTRSDKDNTKQVLKKDRQRQRATSANSAPVAAKSKAWQPSLRSISETTS